MADEVFDPLAGEGGDDVDPRPGPVVASEADPDEEPPEPEGHALSEAVDQVLGSKECFRGVLPHDIAAVWGHPPCRPMDEATARILIGAWGVVAFRGSQLHRTALADTARNANIEEPRTRFKVERERKKRA